MIEKATYSTIEKVNFDELEIRKNLSPYDISKVITHIEDL
jgi:hypothetical protein